LKDLHAGKTCLVIGNGPSLRDIPPEFLGRYPTFGTNRIYLLDGFTPTYYASVNPLVIEQSLAEINAMDCTKFIRASMADKITGAYPLYSSYVPMFSRDPLKCVFEGHTVTYVCLQLAHWMGFKTVLLVGVDHRFDYKGAPNQQVTADQPDVNHFSPDYFGPGVVWNNPDLRNSEKAYHMARLNYELTGRRIINITPGTALDVFEKGNWQEWL